MAISSNQRPALVLGVESSCDETAFSLVDVNGRVLSNAIASQTEIHARYGGVVPEIASRAHMEALIPLFRKSLADAGVSLDQVGLIAATQGPGLAGCLLVGFEFAKGLALRHGIPFAPIHHIAGHVESVFLGLDQRNAWGEPLFSRSFSPYVALVISGGHSSLIAVDAPLSYRILGQTMDDAVGEAYDKIAKLLGLAYPGGPLLDRLAREGDPKVFQLPLPLSRTSSDRSACMFSFSGLKTAVAREVESWREEHPDSTLPEKFIRDLSAAFQDTAVKSLIQKTNQALELTGYKRLAITGGVACNSRVRQEFQTVMRRMGVALAIPEPQFCTDNAAMIAAVGLRIADAGLQNDLALNVRPSWTIEHFGANAPQNVIT